MLHEAGPSARASYATSPDIPAVSQGTFYRTGPGIFELDGHPLHVFDGTLGKGAVSWHKPCCPTEQAARQLLTLVCCVITAGRRRFMRFSYGV